MNLLTKLLMLPVARREVPSSALINFRDVLKGEIESELGWKAEFSNEMLERLVAEAHRRASSEDAHNVARNLAMYVQIEEVAKEVVTVWNDKSAGDGAIRTIVKHYGSIR